MTERGRHAGWTAAALLAPASAAVFAGSAAWANDHDPSAAKTSATQSETDEAVAAQLARRTQEVTKLRAEVAELRDQVAGLPARGDGATSGTTKASGGSTSPRTSTSTAPRTAAPRPAPAPPTQTTTGGS